MGVGGFCVKSWWEKLVVPTGTFQKKAAMVCGDGFITNNVECFHKTDCLEIDFMFKSLVRIPQTIDRVSRSDWS